MLNHLELNNVIKESTVFPNNVPLKTDIGKSGLMWPRGLALNHDAAKLLNYYSEEGCPVECGPDWTHEHIQAALQRGPHKSATNKIAAQCLLQETKDKFNEGYAKTVKWGDIKNNIPKNLKISPIDMIPHKSRQFRAIIDLSFQLKMNGKKMPSVNSATKAQAPQKSMAELGNVLKRIVFNMATNYNKQLPFIFSKCDIKDGFWRMIINQIDAWNFCYVLPTQTNSTSIDDTIIVVPNSLQMGWSESPPFFCSATETARAW